MNLSYYNIALFLKQRSDNFQKYFLADMEIVAGTRACLQNHRYYTKNVPESFRMKHYHTTYSALETEAEHFIQTKAISNQVLLIDSQFFFYTDCLNMKPPSYPWLSHKLRGLKTLSRQYCFCFAALNPACLFYREMLQVAANYFLIRSTGIINLETSQGEEN